MVTGAPKEALKEGPKPSRRTVTPKGWAVGVPYSAATARNRLRIGGVTQSDNAARSVGGSHSVRFSSVHHDRCGPEVAVAQHLHSLSSCLWVAHSSVGSRVARRLPGRHSSVAASRCAAGLDSLWGAVPRESRHLGALKVVFCPQAHAGHVS